MPIDSTADFAHGPIEASIAAQSADALQFEKSAEGWICIGKKCLSVGEYLGFVF